ncbi:response regulator [Lentisalinibacter salinarum]|uniref:response regulator n=1 Tax=Lentisalinibacter salinarum TaxID=2992239 RepID=UPI00386669B4
MEQEHRRVLFVEDNDADARLVELRLEDESAQDLELVRFSCLHEAISATMETDFGVALLDLSLPDGQGLESYRLLRAAQPELPVVVFSGAADQHLALRAIQEGAQDYLVKDDTSARALVRSLRYAIERRQLDRRMRQAQRMEVVGQLAGGVAHDFNNLLTVILGNLQLLDESVDDDEARVYLADALAATERGATLAARLLDVSRPDTVGRRIVDLNEMLRRGWDLFRSTLPESIHLEMDLSDEPVPANVEASQLEQVVLNLTLNARDAMPEGGRLVIETRVTELYGNYSDAAVGLKSGRYAVIAVSDTGCGMPHDVVQRACDPFFTTKGQGKGTGLGLAMAQSCIRQCGGQLRIYSEAGRGTVVRCLIPLAVEESESIDIEQTMSQFALTADELDVLLVEDDEHVRRAAAGMLRNLGHRVSEVERADHALEILQSGKRYDLLFTDIVTPGQLNGLELAARVRELQPNLRVLLCSGYSPRVLPIGEDYPAPMLIKPYSRGDLHRMLQELSR